MLHRDYILIIEDTLSLSAIYEECLKGQGYNTKCVHTGQDALDVLSNETPAAVLLDLKLPDMRGLDILKKMRADGMECAVIVITGEASLNTAGDAMKMGADDFVAKPVDPERLLISLGNALEKSKLKKIVSDLQVNERGNFYGFIGKSPEMQAAYRMIENAAKSKASVMIMGESGTGKEVAAKAIHTLSDRNTESFVALNCAAIPHELLESEIFGHVKGAFTGATANREGAATRADGGTLFLDELTEMPIALQSKLLRFIQEGVFSPVGSNDVIKVNIRFVCATNRNPFDAIKRGIFREDLYYRLAVIPIELPPLRERGGDVQLLAEHFLKKAAEQEGKNINALSEEACNLLKSHKWPGNVRELENMISYAVIMSGEENEITPDMLPVLKSGPRHEAADEDVQHPIGAGHSDSIIPMKDVERAVIENALRICEGNITEAARKLEINPSTIHRKQKQWQ